MTPKIWVNETQYIFISKTGPHLDYRDCKTEVAEGIFSIVMLILILDYLRVKV